LQKQVVGEINAGHDMLRMKSSLLGFRMKFILIAVER